MIPSLLRVNHTLSLQQPSTTKMQQKIVMVIQFQERRTGRPGRLWGLAAAPGFSVSYTHLDVYKRQALMPDCSAMAALISFSARPSCSARYKMCIRDSSIPLLGILGELFFAMTAVPRFAAAAARVASDRPKPAACRRALRGCRPVALQYREMCIRDSYSSPRKRSARL